MDQYRKALLIPVYGEPKPVEVSCDDEGATLHSLQELVEGPIEPFSVLFDDEEICLYVNEEGMISGLCQPNRAIYATRHMADEGYCSQIDPTRAVREGELYTVLFGDIVAIGFDPETGCDRSLTAAEAEEVQDYFTNVSKPGSGLKAIRDLQRRNR